MESHIDINTLSKIAPGVDDRNHNGIFDENDILKGYHGSCGAVAKDSCGCNHWEGNFVLTAKDNATPENLEAFLYGVLVREIRIFTVKNKYGDDQIYAAISRRFCDTDELEYVVRIKADNGHGGDGYGERDEFIHTFEPGTNMKAWLKSAESYLSDK